MTALVSNPSKNLECERLQLQPVELASDLSFVDFQSLTADFRQVSIRKAGQPVGQLSFSFSDSESGRVLTIDVISIDFNNQGSGVANQALRALDQCFGATHLITVQSRNPKLLSAIRAVFGNRLEVSAGSDRFDESGGVCISKVGLQRLILNAVCGVYIVATDIRTNTMSHSLGTFAYRNGEFEPFVPATADLNTNMTANSGSEIFAASLTSAGNIDLLYPKKMYEDEVLEARFASPFVAWIRRL